MWGKTGKAIATTRYGCSELGAEQRRCKVKVGNDVGDSIFVGLPSEREARRVVHAATLDWPAEQ